jgi:S-layer protein (TIGR01567 family)
MNKKITAVTLTALMVLTMFTAMVPSASAAEEVSAPYEFMGAVTAVPGAMNLTSFGNPGLLYFDIDDRKGLETLDIGIDSNLDIIYSNFTYTTSIYMTDENDPNVAWLGQAFYVIDNASGDWWISQKLVDEDEDDDYLLRVGESMSLPEGFTLTVNEIDLEGDEAWFTINQDGEQLYDEVVTTVPAQGDPYFVYEDDLDDDNDEDDVVMNFTVETVFSGMNTNMVKINNIDLISRNTMNIEDGDKDLYPDFEIDLTPTTITIKLEDTDDEISLKSDGLTDIFKDRISIRVNEYDNYAAAVRVVTEPGTYEFMGAVTAVPGAMNLTSFGNPSLLYFDIDDRKGLETLDIGIDSNLDIIYSNFTYTTSIYMTDENDPNVAWLGQAFYVIDNASGDWWISQKLVDEDEDDDYLLRVGESMSLPEGFTLTVNEIDLEGDEAWFTINQDGEQLYDEVVTTVPAQGDPYFVYEDDLDDDNDEDDVVMNFTVETVFSGMNTNMVKINNIDLISRNTMNIEDGDKDLYPDFEIDLTPTTITIKLEDTDDEISLKSDGLTEIFKDRMSIRVNEYDNYAAVVKVVTIGGGPTPTETETAVGTEEPTDEPTNVTGDVTVDGTAAPTEAATETPTPEPTKEPGFEAVFAVAGLLAVAYLVLRQRE